MRAASRINLSIVGFAACVCFCGGCRQESRPTDTAKDAPGVPGTQQTLAPTFAGSAGCRECHEQAYADWKDSHHGLAERPIDVAIDESAFRNKKPIRHGSLTSEVRERNGQLEIVTLGGDGQVRPYASGRAIGVSPLRQYMIQGEGGRYQVAALSYDPKRDEWFDVFGDEDRRPSEWGFWANRGMTWNSMCADCHNTNLKKNYDARTDRYDTTYSELGVGCEACHGPGSAHVEWQRAHKGRNDDPTLSSFATLYYPDVQVDTCGTCHARRVELREDYTAGEPFLDSYRPELPDYSNVYYPDGQVREEDYEYASFLMSRMYANGITCTNCHNYHTGKTWFVGNRLCMNCHAAKLAVDPAAHSHHDLNDTGGLCVNCHMPLTTYMQRHPRRDHAMTIPDPVLTKEFAIPNACNRCHTDKPVDWAIEAAEKWYGPRMNRYTRDRARLMARARAHDGSAPSELISFLNRQPGEGEPKLQGPAWKAIAAGLLRNWVHRSDVRDALIGLLSHPSPLVRTMAASAVEDAGEAAEAPLKPLLDDPVRAVRVATAWALRRKIDPSTRAGRDLQAYLAHNADQPPGLMMLAIYHMDRGRADQAIPLLQQAIAWESNSSVLEHTISVALSAAGRSAEAAEHCERACKLDPDDASLWYSLGLARAELKNTAGAVAALEKACSLDENFTRAWYNLGLAKNASGDPDGAIRALRRATSLEPNSADYWFALAAVFRDAGRLDDARNAAVEALRADFTHQGAQSLLQMLENRSPEQK